MASWKVRKKAPELCRCSSYLGKQNAEFELEILSVTSYCNNQYWVNWHSPALKIAKIGKFPLLCLSRPSKLRQYAMEHLQKKHVLYARAICMCLNGTQCMTDLPITPINQYWPINWIGKSQKYLYRIGSADYKGYRYEYKKNPN